MAGLFSPTAYMVGIPGQLSHQHLPDRTFVPRAEFLPDSTEGQVVNFLLHQKACGVIQPVLGLTQHRPRLYNA